MDREKVIKGLNDIGGFIAGRVGFEQARNFLRTIDDAIAMLKEQEAKTGYWIDSAGNDKCSICGTEYSDLYPDYGNTHFCPNCGAKMKGR